MSRAPGESFFDHTLGAVCPHLRPLSYARD